MPVSEVRPDERGIPTLYVDGAPFFARAGEIHNSSASSPAYLDRVLWPKLRGLNLNTVAAPVYWELLEPEPGRFDFTLPDALLAGARREGLRLVLLWFGLWKNAESMYAPAWMKQDTETYFRARREDGSAMNTISPFCAAAVERDAGAFAALLAHLREADGETGTVILMQVENEIGLLGTARDYCPTAEAAFGAEAPPALAAALGVSGSWREAFGPDAEEAFMAWAFAAAVERIAAAGRAEHPLPCYTNAWLRQYPWYPGSYPAGGPVRGMHPVWKAAAPSLCALAPDIYVPNCADVMDEYAGPDNPLVIAEIRKDAVAASYSFYAFGAKNALCFSPFGVEDLADDPDTADQPPPEVLAALNIDPSAFDIHGSRDYLANAYRLLGALEPLLLRHRGAGAVQAFVRHGETDYGAFLRFDGYDAAVAYAPRETAKPLGAGIFIQLSPSEFLLAGMRCSVAFRPKPGARKTADFLRIEEGTLENGVWVPGRVLNGDEKMAVKFGDLASLYRVTLYQY